MKRLVTLATILFVFTTTALAQDDYKKFEFFGGYSALFVDNLAGDTGSPAVDDVLGEKQTLRGLNLAAGYNFHKYIGAKFDYSIHFRGGRF
jgi:opacity protein-like surface antigen